MIISPSVNIAFLASVACWAFVGGETDILIGIKYLKYHPQKIWESSTGLLVSESSFPSADGTIVIIGGPHAVFIEIEQGHKNMHANKVAYKSHNLSKIHTRFTFPVNQYRTLHGIGKDMPLSWQINVWD